MAKPKETRLPILEVCYRKPDGVSTRADGHDLDWDVKDGRSDQTVMVLQKGNEIVAAFPTTNLVWARVKHKQ